MVHSCGPDSRAEIALVARLIFWFRARELFLNLTLIAVRAITVPTTTIPMIAVIPPITASAPEDTQERMIAVAHNRTLQSYARMGSGVRSHHRRFLDALREGLQLRDQFPQHDIKVQSMKADSSGR